MLVLNYHLPHNSELVFDCLSNMKTFASLHPVIWNMDLIRDDLYLVYEKIPVGSFSYSFKYKARVKANPESRTIQINALVHYVNHIDLFFTLLESDGGVFIREEIVVRSPFPIRNIVYKVFKKQHDLLFRNIANHCQNHS